MTDLQKQVIVPPDQHPELVAMKRKIDRMQGLYVVLFMTSLVVLVMNWSGGMPVYLHLVWALSLGGGPAPLT